MHYLLFLDTYGKTIHANMINSQENSCEANSVTNSCAGRVNHLGSGAEYTAVHESFIRNEFSMSLLDMCFEMDGQGNIQNRDCYTNPTFTCVLDCNRARTKSELNHQFGLNPYFFCDPLIFYLSIFIFLSWMYFTDKHRALMR